MQRGLGLTELAINECLDLFSINTSSADTLPARPDGAGELGMSSVSSQQIPKFPSGSNPDLSLYCILRELLWNFMFHFGSFQALGALRVCGGAAAGMGAPVKVLAFFSLPRLGLIIGKCWFRVWIWMFVIPYLFTLTSREL